MPGGRTAPDGGNWPLSGTPDEQAADIRAYAEAGLDELMLSLNARTLGEYLVMLRRFMREVVPRV
jgi:alkanesulfonate monooxygenase SsuD/methylene tetrahydromethanopterin reductase-like flavin-dependent oxidoreductase (luciferase family)